jgi:hypothetical protein
MRMIAVVPVERWYLLRASHEGDQAAPRPKELQPPCIVSMVRLLAQGYQPDARSPAN